MKVVEVVNILGAHWLKKTIPQIAFAPQLSFLPKKKLEHVQTAIANELWQDRPHWHCKALLLGMVNKAYRLPPCADFVAGAALCEPPCADFVAGAALCEPPCADVVAGAALCEPPCATFPLLCLWDNR